MIMRWLKKACSKAGEIFTKSNFMTVLFVWSILFVARYIISLCVIGFRYPCIELSRMKWQLVIIWCVVELLPIVYFALYFAIHRSFSNRVRNIALLLFLFAFAPLLLLNIVTFSFPFNSHTTNPANFGLYDKHAAVVDDFPTEIPSNATDVVYAYSHILYTEVRCGWKLPEEDFESVSAWVQASYEEENGKYGYEETDGTIRSFWVTLDEENFSVLYESFVS